MMKIRRREIGDIEPIARVHLDSWNAAYRGLIPDTFLEDFTLEKRKDLATKALADDTQETVVIEEGTSVIGFLVFGKSRDGDADQAFVGEILGIYVDPASWRHGAGRQLAEYAQRALRENGARVATLWVLEGNGAARAFYESLGFQLDGGQKEVTLGKPLPAVRYRKAL